jgi:hypothetical protein
MKSCVYEGKSQSRIFMDEVTISGEFDEQYCAMRRLVFVHWWLITSCVTEFSFSIKEKIIGADKYRCTKDAFGIVSSAAEICLRKSCYGIMFVNFKMSRMTNNLSTAPETCSFKCILSISRQWNGFWWSANMYWRNVGANIEEETTRLRSWVRKDTGEGLIDLY